MKNITLVLNRKETIYIKEIIERVSTNSNKFNIIKKIFSHVTLKEDCDSYIFDKKFDIDDISYIKFIMIVIRESAELVELSDNEYNVLMKKLDDAIRTSIFAKNIQDNDVISIDFNSMCGISEGNKAFNEVFECLKFTLPELVMLNNMIKLIISIGDEYDADNDRMELLDAFITSIDASIESNINKNCFHVNFYSEDEVSEFLSALDLFYYSPIVLFNEDVLNILSKIDEIESKYSNEDEDEDEDSSVLNDNHNTNNLYPTQNYETSIIRAKPHKKLELNIDRNIDDAILNNIIISANGEIDNVDIFNQIVELSRTIKIDSLDFGIFCRDLIKLITELKLDKSIIADIEMIQSSYFENQITISDTLYVPAMWISSIFKKINISNNRRKKPFNITYHRKFYSKRFYDILEFLLKESNAIYSHTVSDSNTMI